MFLSISKKLGDLTFEITLVFLTSNETGTVAIELDIIGCGRY